MYALATEAARRLRARLDPRKRGGRALGPDARWLVRPLLRRAPAGRDRHRLADERRARTRDRGGRARSGRSRAGGSRWTAARRVSRRSARRRNPLLRLRDRAPRDARRELLRTRARTRVRRRARDGRRHRHLAEQVEPWPAAARGSAPRLALARHWPTHDQLRAGRTERKRRPVVPAHTRVPRPAVEQAASASRGGRPDPCARGGSRPGHCRLAYRTGGVARPGFSTSRWRARRCSWWPVSAGSGRRWSAQCPAISSPAMSSKKHWGRRSDAEPTNGFEGNVDADAPSQRGAARSAFRKAIPSGCS